MSTENTITMTNEDINDFLPLGPAEVLDEKKNNNLFSVAPEMSSNFLEEEEEEGETTVAASTTEDVLDTLDETKEEETTTTAGKNAAVKAFNKLFEKGLLVPFEDDTKPLDEYTTADFVELIEANFEHKKTQTDEEVRTQFFEALPEELQFAAKYVADGGRDLKGLFKALSQTQEIRELDVKQDAETIMRNYLKLTTRFSDAKIEKEITRYKDLNELESEAAAVKPELDARAQEVIQNQIKQQEEDKKARIKAAEDYTDRVYEALKEANLGGLKLNKSTQTKLFSELTQPKYDSISGRKTNLLGHLLEKYQFIEPNLGLVAEALWLLSEPEKYKEEVMKNATSQAAASTARSLKTAQDNKTTGSAQNFEDKNKITTQNRKPGLHRKENNIFAR